MILNANILIVEDSDSKLDSIKIALLKALPNARVREALSVKAAIDSLMHELPNCRVPCDHVPTRSWPLFKARDLMRGVIESFKQERLQ